MPLGQGFSHSKAPVKTISDIQFGILSPEEIVRSPFLCSFFLAGEESGSYTLLPSSPFLACSRLSAGTMESRPPFVCSGCPWSLLLPPRLASLDPPPPPPPLVWQFSSLLIQHL